MINKRPAYRMVRSTVDVAAVGAFAVGRLGELKRRVWANVLDVVGGLGFVRVVDVQRLRTATHSHRQVLLVAVVLVLDLRQ